jgi:uncharacterized protein (TIGR02118 family)
MSNVQITVLYPNESDATFNMDYYLKTHMPMVQEEFGPYNFEGYSVLKLVGTPDPSTKSPYTVQATLNFKSVKDFQEALGAKAEKVLGDVPNFSNKGPTLMIGEKMA